MPTRRRSTSTATWVACAERFRASSTTSQTTSRRLRKPAGDTSQLSGRLGTIGWNEGRRRTMELRTLKTWYTARDGWVTLDDDVLSIVRQVRDLFGNRVTVEMNPQNGDYVFVEHCEDGADRLIFTTQELDGRCVERLLRAD